MAPTYPSFATPEQYAQLTGTEVDPEIQGTLDAASAMIRRYCGWHIAPEITEDLVVDGSGGKVQTLPTLRLGKLDGLIETRNSVMTIWDPDDIEWSRNGYLRRVGIWTDRLQGITASVTHGFSLDDVSDLTAMAVTMAARAEASPFGEKQTAVGAVSVTLSSGPGGASGGVSLYADQLAQLDAYRLNQRL